VMELLGEVHASGQSLVIVTHDQGIGAGAPKLVTMRDGRVVSDGAPDTRLAETALRAIVVEVDDPTIWLSELERRRDAQAGGLAGDDLGRPPAGTRADVSGHDEGTAPSDS
jgi:energy-coupling factor transporter ATP-binding protein EcfA2